MDCTFFRAPDKVRKCRTFTETQAESGRIQRKVYGEGTLQTLDWASNKGDLGSFLRLK